MDFAFAFAPTWDPMHNPTVPCSISFGCLQASSLGPLPHCEAYRWDPVLPFINSQDRLTTNAEVEFWIKVSIPGMYSHAGHNGQVVQAQPEPASRFTTIVGPRAGILCFETKNPPGKMKRHAFERVRFRRGNHLSMVPWVLCYH